SKGARQMPLSAAKLAVGQEHTARLVEDLKRTQIVQYAGASGDYNPLHTDEIFTTQVAGYPSVFAHGMLTMGMTGKMLTDYVGDARLTKYGVRFTSQVFPGDTLDAKATVKALTERDGVKLVEFDVSTTNQNGVEVLSGYAEARVDP
ncbi:MAG: MaoC/PaaZ C-terminal domain-containing protein, partial [Phenylobacterium sp.]